MQTIDVRDAVRYLRPYILGGAVGRVADVGGPQVLNFREMARQWLEAQKTPKPIVGVPIPFSEGFKQGLNTAPCNAFGSITWADYLRERFPS